MADGTSGKDLKITDPLIERAKILGLSSAEILEQLGIGFLEGREGEDKSSVALRTSQELLKPVYTALIKEIGGTDAEDFDAMDGARLDNPQAFIDSTLALMDAYGDKVSGASPNQIPLDPISLSGALSATCLIEPASHSTRTVEWAKKVVSMDTKASTILPNLRTLHQASSTK